MANPPVAARIRVKGRVQGVGYRYFAQETAVARGLKGWVRNVPDGSVECEVEGHSVDVDQWMDELRKGPPMARIETLQVDWIPVTGYFNGFEIR